MGRPSRRWQDDSKEGGYHREQESNRQKTMEGTDGGLHPAVDGQSPGERKVKEIAYQFIVSDLRPVNCYGYPKTG